MVVKAGVWVEARFHTNVAVEVKNLSSKIKRCNNIIHVCFFSLLLFNYLSKQFGERDEKKTQVGESSTTELVMETLIKSDKKLGSIRAEWIGHFVLK